MNGRFLCSAGMFLLLAVHPGRGVASPDSGGATEITAPRERAPGGGRRAPDPGKAVEKERRIEREKRFISRTIDDLKGALADAEGESGEIENEIDAITLLEFPQRERDFQDFRDWYVDYGEWLREMIVQYEEDLTWLSSDTPPAGSDWRGRYGAIAGEFGELELEIGKKAESFNAEEKRLAGILDRRRLLQGEFNDLSLRLARIDDRLRELQTPGPEKRDYEKRGEKLRTEITVVQNELLSLPLVDEALLKHYAVLAERGAGERTLLALKRDEYGALREVAAIIDRDPRRDAPSIEAAYRRVTRVFESEINRLKRRSDELDRRRSRVTPAGTLREVARSRELAGYYERLQGRYEEQIRRLKTLIGAHDAELSEVLSEKGR